MENLINCNRSPLNNSKSKAMFSFPKANRFQSDKENIDAFYDNSISSLSKRATSMGFGKKSDISNGYDKSPSPDRYQIEGQFEKNIKKGKSFGLGRQDIKFVSIFNKNINPGPGAYQVKNNQKNSSKYSIRQKISFPEIFISNKYPGPGCYEVESLNKEGYYFNSKLKSNFSYSIHKGTQKTENNNTDSNIGPGSYNIGLSSTGKQILAKNKSQQISSFPKKYRETLSVSMMVPGPGTYETFYQFGK